MMTNRITRAADIIWRRIDDEVVVIGEDGLSLHALNKTAAHIWEMCDGNYGLDEISASLYERFDITLEEASADAHDTIDKLVKLSILKWDDGEPGNEHEND